MSSRPKTPIRDSYGSVPALNDPSHLERGYGADQHATNHADANEYGATPGNPAMTSPLSQTNRVSRYGDDFEAEPRGSSVMELEGAGLHRTASRASHHGGGTPSRSNTLKKKGSVSRKSSLKRSGSRRSMAGSIKGMSLHDSAAGTNEFNSVFYTPIPTTGSPTDILADRFQAWRKLLKELISYFHEVQLSYENRSKALHKVSAVANNLTTPSIFVSEGGLNDATRILRDYHKQVVTEAGKARDIESDVITQLSNLRHDLASKIKEIKSLSGDFKNSVEKEKDGTRKAVVLLKDALDLAENDPHAVIGRDDPYVIRLGVERQVERQIDEENYLHRAYLNLEESGRELEKIVVGEIQKSYNALTSIMKREADEAYGAIEQLRTGPIQMPRDYEWDHFVEHDPYLVGPDIPLRHIEDVEYPGKSHPAAAEVRAGMLERKSKYLKSYTPGWYVLSPTHLHEFKSADRIYTQPPVMSLLLADQKLGSHSQPGSSSNKFMLKGRQTGSMHRGHSWVFRAESYDTMLAWYDDIKALTEKSGEERNAFVRKHARSLSAGSAKAMSISSASDLQEDEADEVPYSANASGVLPQKSGQEKTAPQRPQPGGRFPSDLQVTRDLHAPLSPSSGSSQDVDRHGENVPHFSATPRGVDTQGQQPPTQFQEQIVAPTPQRVHPSTQQIVSPIEQDLPGSTQRNLPLMQPIQSFANPEPGIQRHDSNYGSWMASAAGGAAVGAGATGVATYRQQNQEPGPESGKQYQENTPTSATVTGPLADAPAAAPSDATTSGFALGSGSTADTSIAGDAAAGTTAAGQKLPATAVAPTSTAGAAFEPAQTQPTSGSFLGVGSSAAMHELDDTAAAAGTAAQNTDTDTGKIVASAPVAVHETVETDAAQTSGRQAAMDNSGAAGEKRTAYNTARDGSPNARATGSIFPAILRHNTDVSVRDLHVPGEWSRESVGAV